MRAENALVRRLIVSARVCRWRAESLPFLENKSRQAVRHGLPADGGDSLLLLMRLHATMKQFRLGSVFICIQALIIFVSLIHTRVNGGFRLSLVHSAQWLLHPLFSQFSFQHLPFVRVTRIALQGTRFQSTLSDISCEYARVRLLFDNVRVLAERPASTRGCGVAVGGSVDACLSGGHMANVSAAQ
jgi:hypothetical protein